MKNICVLCKQTSSCMYNNMKVYHIGKIVVTQQAFLVLVMGAIASFITLILAMMHNPVFIVSALATFGMTCYSAYIVNCSVVGKCIALSWFMSILTAIYFVLAIIALVFHGLPKLRVGKNKSSK